MPKYFIDDGPTSSKGKPSEGKPSFLTRIKLTLPKKKQLQHKLHIQYRKITEKKLKM